MYAVVVESFGNYGCIVPCGNDGLQKLRNKTPRGWKSETKILRKNTTGIIYVISDFTQKMCEMSPRKLADYVMQNYVAIIPKH